jgi:hypothetical protein
MYEKAKERTVNETLLKMLGSLEIREPVSHGPLHLFPLASGSSREDGLALLAEALGDGSLRVEEMDEGSSVPELRVLNRGSVPVLILEGDELIGAKQNRVVNSSVLVPAGAELILPVSCVERGRWSRNAGSFFSGDGSPHLTLRRLKSRSVHDSLRRTRRHASDQLAVWEEVDRKAYRHDAPSPTDALQDAREHARTRLDAFLTLADRMPQGSRGVVVVLGERPVFAEILAGPRTFARAFGRLLRGYAFEALEWEGGARSGVAAANGFLAAMIDSRREEHPAVGAGTDVRFSSSALLGYALVHEENVLHAAAFAR